MGVAFATSVSFSTLLSALPLWVAGRVVPSASAGLPTTLMLMVTIAVQPSVPFLLRRLHAGAVQAVGLVTLGAPALLFFLRVNLSLLLVISAIRGVGFAILTVAVPALIASLVPPSRHGESVALYGLTTAIPTVVGTPVGVALTKAGHFGAVALIASTPLLVIPLAFMIGRAPSRHVPSPGARDKTTTLPKSLARVWPPALFLFVGTVAAGGLTAYLPIAVRQASLPLLLMGLAIALGRWLVRHLARRFGIRILMPACSIASAAGVALISVGMRSGYPWVIIGAVVFGLGLGAIQSLSMIVIFARALTGSEAMASAVWNVSFDAGTGVGAGLVGGLSGLGIGIPSAILVTAGLVVVSIPFTGRDRRERA
jgi:predicted MFS family arabinose efflux permease